MPNDTANSPVAGGGEGSRPLSSLVHRTDFVLAVALLVICGLLYYFTTEFEEVPEAMLDTGVIPPEWFPQLLIWLIGLLTLIIPFEHVFHPEGKDTLDSDRKAKIKPIAFFTAIMLCIVVALMPWLGTAACMVLASVLMPPLWGERRWKAIIAFAVIFPGIVALLFTQVLKVYFEPGIWEKLF